MDESASTGWFDALIEGGPGILAGIVGTLLVIVGLVFAIWLAFAASGALRRNERGRLPAGFDDAWWALRHAAYFCLAVISLGVLLLLGPVLSSGGDESSPSASSSPDAAVTEEDGAKKGNKADKPDHDNRGNRGDHDNEDEDDAEGNSSDSPSASPSASPSPSAS